MITEILSAAASVKALNDILHATYDLHTFNQVVAALSKVNTDLINAQSAALKAQSDQAQLVKRVEELEAQLAAAARWETVAKSYKLRELVPGVFAYEYMATGPDAEPLYVVCAHCFQLQLRSILQVSATSAAGKRYQCPRCGTELDAHDPAYTPMHIPIPRYGSQGWMG